MTIIEKFADAGGIRTKYLESGSGTPMVLLHGLAVWSGVWKFNIESLAQDYRVIVPDLIGHGDTDKPQKGSYDPSFYSKWLADFLEDVEVKDAALVGNSLAGGIVFHYVATFPHTITHLILLDPAGISRSLCLEYRLVTLPIIGKFLARPSYKAIKKLWEKSFADSKRLPEEFVKEHFERAKDPLGQYPFNQTLKQNAGIRGIKNQIVNHFEEYSSNMKIPILIIWGDEDEIIPMPKKDYVLKFLPHAQFEVIPDCGHTPMIEHPETVNRMILDFLEG